MLQSENLRLWYFIVFALAILLYTNTLYHQFVLDDGVVISGNTFVQKGIDGIPDIITHDSFAGYQKVDQSDRILEGGRYRPLSLVIFAVIHSVFGSDPLPFHLFSILLYALSGLMVFKWLLLLLRSEAYGKWIALVTTLLFVAHPLHTEVVANVKSTDEILALFFGVGAMTSLLKSFDGKSKLWMAISCILMLAACMAKENAITFLLVAPLSIWFFRDVKVAPLIIRSLPLIIGGILFLFIRYTVIGPQSAGLMMHDPLNNPFLEWTGNGWVACSPLIKAATILYTFGLSLKLMVVPYPLTHDYYPFHIGLQSFSSLLVLLSLLIFLSLLIYGAWSIPQKKKAGFGIICFLVTASVTFNVFFPVGVFMAERFLFIPSLGFLFVVIYSGFHLADEKHQKVLFTCLMPILVVFSVLTVLRNPAWKDNETLFRTDIIHSLKSAKGQNDLGTIILDNALKAADTSQRRIFLMEALPHLQRAIELHPTYYDAYLASGACAYYLQQYDQSVNAYRTATMLFPEDVKSKTGLRYALQAYGRDQWARHDTITSIAAMIEAWNMQSDSATASELAKYYQFLGQSEKSNEWRDKARGGFQ